MRPFKRPKTMLCCQMLGEHCALICFETGLFAKCAKTKDATVNWNTRVRFDLKGLFTHYSYTFRCTRQTGTSIGSDAAPLHLLHFTRYVVSKHTPTGTNPSKSPERRDEIGAAMNRCRAGHNECGEAVFPNWKPQVQMSRPKKDQR